MSLRPFIGRSIFDEMEDMVDRCFDRRFSGEPVFDRGLSSGSCPMDLIEQPEKYLIHADAPGMEKGDIKVELRGNQMTISGERQEEKRQEEKGFTRYERSSQSFARSIRLPKDADGEHVEAALDRGVLSLTIPRKQLEEAPDVKRIDIK